MYTITKLYQHTESLIQARRKIAAIADDLADTSDAKTRNEAETLRESVMLLHETIMRLPTCLGAPTSHQIAEVVDIAQHRHSRTL